MSYDCRDIGGFFSGNLTVLWIHPIHDSVRYPKNAYKPLNHNKSSLKRVLSEYQDEISLMSPEHISWLFFVLLSLIPVCGHDL